MSAHASRPSSLVDETPSILIEAFAENAKPASLRLRQGNKLGTLTLGTRGDWRITAPGVGEVHAAIHFNGDELYIVEGPDSPTYVDGQRVWDAWLRVNPPATIEFGAARLDVHDFEVPRQGILRKTKTANMRDTLVDAQEHAPSAVVKRRASSPAPAVDPDKTLEDNTTIRPTAVSIPDNLAPAHPETDEFLATTRIFDASAFDAERARRARIPIWRELPLPLGVLATLIALYVGLTVPHAPNVPPQLSVATQAVAPKAAPAPAPLTQSAQTPIFIVLIEPIKARDSEDPAAQKQSQTQPAEVSRQERRAVYALLSGDRREALRIYEKLARARPDVPDYRNAVQVLRKRVPRATFSADTSNKRQALRQTRTNAAITPNLRKRAL